MHIFFIYSVCYRLACFASYDTDDNNYYRMQKIYIYIKLIIIIKINIIKWHFIYILLVISTRKSG